MKTQDHKETIPAFRRWVYATSKAFALTLKALCYYLVFFTLISPLLALAKVNSRSPRTFGDYEKKYNENNLPCPDPYLNKAAAELMEKLFPNDQLACTNDGSCVDPLDSSAWPAISKNAQVMIHEFRSQPKGDVVVKASRVITAEGESLVKTQLIKNKEATDSHATSYHIDPKTGRVVNIVEEEVSLQQFKEGLENELGYVVEGEHEERRCGKALRIRK